MRKGPWKVRLTVLTLLAFLYLALAIPLPASAAPPPAPTNLVQVGLNSTDVSLSWDPSPVTVDGYRVYYAPDGVLTWTLAGGHNGTWYPIYSLTPDTSYSIIVKAYIGAEESVASNMLTIHTPPIPATPSGLTAAYNSSLNMIELNWADNSFNETGFKIYRKIGAGSYSWYISIGADAVYYTDTAITPGYTYYYKVIASREGDESPFSNEASASVPLTLVIPPILTPPAAPSDLIVTTGTPFTIGWRDNSSDETSFIVERSLDGVTFSPLGTVPADTTTFTDTTYFPGLSHWYRVKAQNSIGDSAYSNVLLSLMTMIPPAPSGLNAAATLSGDGSIGLTWTDNSSDETGFIIERRTAGGSYAVLDTVAANATSYTDTREDLTLGTTYYYQVKAQNPAGDSAYSNESFAVAPPVWVVIPLTPSAPTNLTAVIDSGAIKLTWTDNSLDETQFTLERKVGPGAFTGWVGLWPDNTSYIDVTSLTPGTTYTYRVYAQNAAGSSGYSNEASVTLPAALPTAVIPAAPTGLTAAVSGTSVSLAWSDNSSDELGFRIERKSAGGSYALLSNRPANAVSFADTSAAAGTTYTYRVSAFNTAGDSAYSNEASAAIPTVIPPVTPAGTKVIRLYIGRAEYYVNDELKTMDTVPIITEGRTMLPIRYVSEPLGATVGWNDADKKVTVTMGSRTIIVWIGQNTGRVDGSSVQIDPANSAVTPLIVPPGRTMLPLRFIAENLGCKVDWEPTTQEVKITYPKP